MIKLPNGQWCFSPAMPEAYAVEGRGPGAWVKGDLAKWNLVYLTWRGELEMFRQGKTRIDALLKVITPEKFGIVAASSREDFDEVFPGLHTALKGPVSLFIHVFSHGCPAELPADALFATPIWSKRVMDSAKAVFARKCDADDALPTEGPASVEVRDNVVHVNFGRQA